MKIVYLKPKSSFRENLRSDTLWGLICWGIKTVFSEETLVDFINNYEDGKVCKISSAYRYNMDDNGIMTLLFPKPILKPLDLNEFFEKNNIDSKKSRAEYIKKIKAYKKVRFIDKETFDKFLTGELDEEKYFLQDGWSQIKSNFKREDILHNTINRMTNTTVKDEGSLFSTTELFAKKGGLFFLIDGDEEQIKLITGALNFFSHLGFGGDSSIGKNHFEVSIEDISFPKIEENTAFVILSLYSPKTEEVLKFRESKERFWYELVARKGKMGGQFIKAKNFWKKSVLLFKEGSVLPNIGGQNYGRNIKVLESTNEHTFPVYHFGYAFNLPINLK